MENIIEPNAHFDFTKLSLVDPTSIQGGGYFTKLLYSGKPLYIQTPHSLTREGFQKNGKKFYCDMMFDNGNEEFITWIEKLESKCQKMVHERSNDWFDSALELTDIESAFNSSLKLYKSGKNYLLRGHVKSHAKTQAPLIKIYNEDENVLTMADINTDTHIVGIIEVIGIKFTERNFQIEYDMKQVMTLAPVEEIFESCMIKKTTNSSSSSSSTKILNTKDKPISNIEKADVVFVSPDILSTGKNDKTLASPKLAEEEEEEESVSSDLLEQLSDNIFQNIDKDCDKESIVEKNTRINAMQTQPQTRVDNSTLHDSQTHSPLRNNLTTVVNRSPKGGTTGENPAQVEACGRVPMDYRKYTEDNIILDIEDLNAKELVESIEEEDPDELKEVNITKLNKNIPLETIALKKPNEVYYEIYKEARKKAKEAKKSAVIAYLEARNIKKTYMLDDIDSSDNDSDNDSDNEYDNDSGYF